MRRRVTFARIQRLERAADQDHPNAGGEWEALMQEIVAIVVEATGITDELVPTPHGWKYRYARSAHAFARSLPPERLASLFDGEDISSDFPLHARAWNDPNDLSRAEWETINHAPSVW